jgi:hypothetical protein
MRYPVSEFIAHGPFMTSDITHLPPPDHQRIPDACSFKLSFVRVGSGSSGGSGRGVIDWEPSRGFRLGGPDAGRLSLWIEKRDQEDRTSWLNTAGCPCQRASESAYYPSHEVLQFTRTHDGWTAQTDAQEANERCTKLTRLQPLWQSFFSTSRRRSMAVEASDAPKWLKNMMSQVNGRIALWGQLLISKKRGEG